MTYRGATLWRKRYLYLNSRMGHLLSPGALRSVMKKWKLPKKVARGEFRVIRQAAANNEPLTRNGGMARSAEVHESGRLTNTFFKRRNLVANPSRVTRGQDSQVNPFALNILINRTEVHRGAMKSLGPRREGIGKAKMISRTETRQNPLMYASKMVASRMGWETSVPMKRGYGIYADPRVKPEPKTRIQGNEPAMTRNMLPVRVLLLPMRTLSSKLMVRRHRVPVNNFYHRMSGNGVTGISTVDAGASWAKRSVAPINPYGRNERLNRTIASNESMWIRPGKRNAKQAERWPEATPTPTKEVKEMAYQKHVDGGITGDIRAQVEQALLDILECM